MQKNKVIKILLIVFLVTFFIDSMGVYAATWDIDCKKIPETLKILKELLGMIKIIVPILLIVLGTVDFVKAMVAQDEQQMKKAQGAFVKRLIIGVAIFFVPMIMRFLLGLVGYGDSCLYQVWNF